MKNLQFVLTVAVLLIFKSFSASAETPVLLEINGTKVTKGEFLYIYEKNNPRVDDLYAEEEVRSYLDLFVEFKLKVHEAKQLGLDTTEEFLNEFNGYRNDLARPYLTDEETIEKMVREAYERSSQLVRASHILIRTEEDASPEDTAEAYNKMLDIREKYKDGESFDRLASEYSEDPSAERNQGDLGYFSAFDMALPFEDKAYNTEPGEVSMPFRTNFGYHILKVHDRKANPGEVEAAHIMIVPGEQGRSPEDARIFADSVHQMLEDGENFEELAQKYSDDQHTAERGGQLQKFSYTERQLPREFVDAAFSVDEGEYSRPVETSFGWHIIKNKELHPFPSYEEKKTELEQKVRNSDRIEVSKKAAVENIKEEHGYDQPLWPFLWMERSTGVDEKLLKGEWKYEGGGFWSERTLFSVGSEKFTRKDFALFMEENQKNEQFNTIDEAIQGYFDQFVEEKVLTYQDENLEKNYPEFRNIANEYRDGLLLFEIMEQKVWNRANQDTTGLKEFFEQNRENYKRGPVASVRKFELSNQPDEISEADEMSSEKVHELIEKFEKEGKFQEELNFTEESWNELESAGGFEKSAFAFQNETNAFKFYYINDIEEEAVPELSQIRGQVSSDYQNQLEKQWIAELKEKYEVTINQEALQSIIKD